MNKNILMEQTFQLSSMMVQRECLYMAMSAVYVCLGNGDGDAIVLRQRFQELVEKDKAEAISIENYFKGE